MRDVLDKVLLLAICSAGAIPVTAAHAAPTPITYSINETIGSGHVTGTVGTDGTIGALSVGDIVDWALTLTSGSATYTLNKSNSVVRDSGSDLTATASSLLFDYSGSDNGYLLFQDGLFSGNHYWCNQATATSVCAQGASVVPQSYLDPSFQNVGRSGTQVIGTAVSAVPLPATLPLFGAAVLALAGLGYGVRRHGAVGRKAA